MLCNCEYRETSDDHEYDGGRDTLVIPAALKGKLNSGLLRDDRGSSHSVVAAGSVAW